MPDFSDIALEYEKIKGQPEKIDEALIKKNEVGGVSADDSQKRQNFLPSEEQHYKLEQKLSKMFDKSSRAGARTSLGGLVLPNGLKNFADFHNNFTGTGRISKKAEPSLFKSTDSKVETRRDIAMLYERCVDCCERVNKDDCEVNTTILPPFDRMTPQEVYKWQLIGLKPGMWICYLFCRNCPKKAAEELKKIRNDKVLSSIVISLDGKPISLAEKRSQEYIRSRADRISDHVHMMFKQERENPVSQAFYGSARIV